MSHIIPSSHHDFPTLANEISTADSHADFSFHPLARAYALEYAADRLVKDVSFVISDKDKPLLFAFALALRQEGRIILGNFDSYPGPGLYHPLTAPCDADQWPGLAKMFQETLRQAARDTGASEILVRHSPLLNPVPIPGLFKTPGWQQGTHAELAVDLILPEADLWKDLRKSYKSLIHRGEESYVFQEMHADNYSADLLEEYRLCHARAAGRVTRSPETFRIMGEWVRQGFASLFTVHWNHRVIQHALVTTWRDMAFYKSAADEPGLDLPTPAMHALQWHIIKALQSRGFKRYILGPDDRVERPWNPATDKEKSIAFFKSGFAAGSTPLHLWRILHT